MTSTNRGLARTGAVGRATALGGLVAIALLGVSAPAVAAGPTLGPNLLKNGGFEEPAITPTAANYGLVTYASGDTIPGWDYISPTDGVVYVATAQPASYWPPDAIDPAEGNQFIGLFTPNGQHNGPDEGYSLYQQFPTEVGKTYQVSYWIAGGPNVGTLCAQLLCGGGVNVGDDGGGGSSSTDHSPKDSTWVYHTATYVATKTLGGISVGGGANPGGVPPLFDGVAVQEVIPAVVDTPIASAPVVLLSITGAGVALAGVLAVLGWRRRVASPAPRSNATP